MKIEIKSIYGSVVFGYDCESNTILKTLLKAIEAKAYLQWADLRWADLRWADLRGADLRGADLRWADLRGADLRWADFRDANLRGADLQGADLREADLLDANLRGANLRGANLRWADLRWADLQEANLDKRYLSVTRIGSRKGMTTYCFEDDIIWCGCFTGTLKEFEDKVNETHNDNPQYLKEYTGFITYLKSLK
jgi:uncharacterized protein YbdZ (MbtH family)